MSCSGVPSLHTLKEEQKLLEIQLTKKLEEQKTIELHLRKSLDEHNGIESKLRKQIDDQKGIESKLRQQVDDQKGIESALRKELDDQKQVESKLRKEVENQRAELDAKAALEAELLKDMISFKSNELQAVHKELETEDQLLEMESKLTELKTELSHSSKKNLEIESKLKNDYTSRETEMQSQLIQLKDSLAWYQNYFNVQQIKEKEMLLLQAQYEDISQYSKSLQSKLNALELDFNSRIEVLSTEVSSKDQIIIQLNTLVDELSKQHKEDIQRLSVTSAVSDQLSKLEEKSKHDVAIASRDKDKIQSLDNALTSLKMQYETQQIELTIYHQKHTEAEKSLTTLKAETEACQKSMIQSNTKCSQLEQNLVDMNNSLVHEREQHNDYVMTLQTQINTLQAAHEKAITDLQKLTESSELEYDRLNSKIYEVTKLEVMTKQEAEYAKQQNDSLSTKLTKVQGSHDALQSKFDSLNTELRLKGGQNIQLTDQLKEESALHKVNRQQLQIEIERILQEKSNMEEQLRSREQKSNEDAATIDIQFMSICREQKAVQSLENHVEALKAENELSAAKIDQQALNLSQEKEKLQLVEQAMVALKGLQGALKHEMIKKEAKYADLEKSFVIQKEELKRDQTYLRQ